MAVSNGSNRKFEANSIASHSVNPVSMLAE